METFSPPDNFSFDKPTECSGWKKHFGRFMIATKLNIEDGEAQDSSLICAMGGEAENVFKSFISFLMTTMG